MRIPRAKLGDKTVFSRATRFYKATRFGNMSDLFDSSSFSDKDNKGIDPELEKLLMVEKQKAQFNAQVKHLNMRINFYINRVAFELFFQIVSTYYILRVLFLRNTYALMWKKYLLNKNFYLYKSLMKVSKFA